MRKIAFIHEYYPMGGAEMVTSHISCYLSGKDVDITLFVLNKKEEDISEVDRRNIRFIQLPDKNKFQSLDNAKFVVEQLKENHIDYFILPGHILDCIAYIRQNTTCKIIFHLHGSPLWEADNDFILKERAIMQSGDAWAKFEWKYLRKPKAILFGTYKRRIAKRYRELYDNVDCYAVLCDAYKEQIEKIMGEKRGCNKVKTLINPLLVKSIPSLTKRKEVLYVGRMSYADKRVDRLLDIWSRIEPEFPDWELKLVGDGEERENLEQQAQALKLKRVHFYGYSADPREYYQTAAILCMTSTFEGWGLVLVEAQAAGVVPIAFSCSGGVKQILGKDGSVGVVVTPFNIYEYTQKLTALMRDENRRKRMQSAMLTKVQEYSLENTGQQWLNMFDDLDAQ